MDGAPYSPLGGPLGQAANGHLGRDETLLLIDIINAEGRLSVRTVWAATADRRAGPRLTRFEHVTDAAQLLHRLGELVPALCWSS
jgi:hypothetical protein